jgi:hypothetical protein
MITVELQLQRQCGGGSGGRTARRTRRTRPTTRRCHPACRRSARRFVAHWPNRDPLGDEAFFTLYAAGKSPNERKLLRRESLKPLYVFVANDSINRTDALGLKIDAAWCQQWLNDCTRDNLLNLKSCLGCMGPSVGAGVATCAIGCLKWASGGWVTYGTCFVACSGVDAVVFMVGSSWCRDAFADGMKGCKEGYERCMDRVSE